MKSPTMRNSWAPLRCNIITMCLITSQILLIVTSKSANEPNLIVNDVDTSNIRISRELLESTVVSDSCPHCNSLSEMPMELADKINEINDVDIFVHDFVDDTNSLSNFSSLEHPRTRRAARDQLRQATCQPIDTIVSLIPADERDPTVFYFPSCVMLKQCGGCCSHSGTTCAAVEEVEKQVTVKKTKFTGGPKLQNLGDVSMTVKEHKRCKCQCKKTAADCNSLQKFIPNQCRCECQNYDAQDNCVKEQLKLWDTKSCSCVCRDTKDCSTGYEFDQGTCSCEPTG